MMVVADQQSQRASPYGLLLIAYPVAWGRRTIDNGHNSNHLFLVNDDCRLNGNLTLRLLIMINSGPQALAEFSSVVQLLKVV